MLREKSLTRSPFSVLRAPVAKPSRGVPRKSSRRPACPASELNMQMSSWLEMSIGKNSAANEATCSALFDQIKNSGDRFRGKEVHPVVGEVQHVLCSCLTCACLYLAPMLLAIAAPTSEGDGER